MRRQFGKARAMQMAFTAVVSIASTLIAVSAWAQAPFPQLPGATVVVVRHAERAQDDPSDPTLTAAGVKRADALAAALEKFGVDAAITTHLKRTQLTAAPTVAKAGITPTVVTPKRGDTAGHIADVVAAVDSARREKKQAILIVGHSNTVPLIVKALSGVAVPNMCESQHADFYVVTLAGSDAATARLIHSRYGEADPPVTADCK